MENFLKSKKIWNVIKSGISEPETKVALRALTNEQTSTLNSRRLKHLKAKNYLFQRSIDFGNHFCKRNLQADMGLDKG